MTKMRVKEKYCFFCKQLCLHFSKSMIYMNMEERKVRDETLMEFEDMYGYSKQVAGFVGKKCICEECIVDMAMLLNLRGW